MANPPPTPPRSEAAAILSGLLAGGRYGVKIRFPHALIMTLLFRRDLPAKKKCSTILKLAAEHGSNLAAFAALYKAILAALKSVSRRSRMHLEEGNFSVLHSFCRWIVLKLIDGAPASPALVPLPHQPPGMPERPRHALIAGALGGAAVWGRYSSINYQINLYLAVRILVGGLTLARERGVPPFNWTGLTFNRSYRVTAAAVWGIVMLFFEECPHVLHPSLRKSMDEIYRWIPQAMIETADGGVGGSESAPRRKR